MRVPLAQVLSWPVSHVDLHLAFLAKEPPAEDRIEWAIAQLSALMFNINRAKETAALGPSDFLPFADAWRDPAKQQGLTDEEMEMMGHLHSRPTT